MNNLSATETKQLEALPVTVEHEGRIYTDYCKHGRNIATGAAVACYQADDYDRIWLDANGNVYAD